MLQSEASRPIRKRRQQDIGIIEVAEAAGVSTATVSRVINNPSVVSEKTRLRVEQAMAELNFSVNSAASALRRGHGKVIMVLAASLAQPWYTKLMRALKTEIERRGYTMMQLDLQHDAETLREALDATKQQLPAGLVLATGDALTDEDTVDAIELAYANYPIVVIGQLVDGAKWPTVQFTDEEWAYRATKGFLEFTKDVAFLGRIEGSYLAAERQKGYERAAGEAGVDLDRWIWNASARGYETGLIETTARLDAGDVPGAIFAINDELALGATRALLTRGFRIPEDVSVMGYGNTDFLEYVTPSLSSVDGSATDAATVAIEGLWAQLEGRAFEPLTVLDRTIVHRESSRPGEATA